MVNDPYAELTEKCVEALRANRDTVEIAVSDLLILLAKAQMQRYPIFVPTPQTETINFPSDSSQYEIWYETPGRVNLWRMCQDLHISYQ